MMKWMDPSCRWNDTRKASHKQRKYAGFRVVASMSSDVIRFGVEMADMQVS